MWQEEGLQAPLQHATACVVGASALPSLAGLPDSEPAELSALGAMGFSPDALFDFCSGAICQPKDNATHGLVGYTTCSTFQRSCL